MRKTFPILLVAYLLASCGRIGFIIDVDHVPAVLTLAVTPSDVTRGFGESVTFTAQVTGSDDVGVSWSVEEGNAGGQVGTSGVYTAPNVAGVYHVRATSTANPAVFATATVRVVDEVVQVGQDCIDTAPTTFDALGAGTVAAPFVLCTTAQLLHLMTPASAAAWSSHFRLAADIDLSGYTQSTSPRVAPIGDASRPFSGTFDGAGFAITALQLDEPSRDYLGLFGLVAGSAAVVRDLHLIDATVVGNRRVGLLVGALHNGATVSQCTSTGAGTGNEYVGGLVGAAGGDFGPPASNRTAAIISASSSSASVDGSASVGGLVGQMGFGFISNSYATGNVTTLFGRAGGLAGVVLAGFVTNAYATGNVDAGAASAGGLVGDYQYGNASHCFATGNVVGADGASTGLLLGDDGTVLIDSYSFAGATCNGAAAGVACHALSSGETQLANLADFATATSPAVSGWDLVRVWTVGAAFPSLAGQAFDRQAWGGCAAHQSDAPFAGGWGTIEAPFLICTAVQLAAIGANSATLAGHFVFELADDIDLGAGPTAGLPIGSVDAPFVGIFDGKGHTVSGFNLAGLSGSDHGLFARFSGLIRRLGMLDATLSGGVDAQGVIAGSMDVGLIQDSFAEGTVSASGAGVGGLVGALRTDVASILNCYFAGSVGGGFSTGGLVGHTDHDGIDGSFVSADVVATTSGGPLATNTGPASASYFDGTKSCTGCTVADGVSRSPTSYFFDPLNAPLTGWDFDHVWVSNAPSAFPSLR